MDQGDPVPFDCPENITESPRIKSAFSQMGNANSVSLEVTCQVIATSQDAKGDIEFAGIEQSYGVEVVLRGPVHIPVMAEVIDQPHDVRFRQRWHGPDQAFKAEPWLAG
jgi:hypothetical protein